MARITTKREADALIARYIEPYPGDARIEEYRLREEEHGYPVWSIIGSLAPDGENAAQVAQDYDISPEAIAAARAFYARTRRRWIIASLRIVRLDGRGGSLMRCVVCGGRGWYRD